ncbi:MAG TPA: hypothetical protein VEF33_14305, partial [Syntrophales bacterium]|nr:hypothetical protein [Syntrophales bacterium]
QTGYSSNLYLPSIVPDKAPAAAGQDQVDENSGIASLEYKSILNNASVLLSNPHISALERVEILNVLAQGKIASVNGATGELNTLFNEIKKSDPGLAAKGDSFQKGPSTPQNISTGQDEGNVTYQDQSGCRCIVQISRCCKPVSGAPGCYSP